MRSVGMNVLHIHNEITNKGGTEVYLADLQAYLPQYGCNSYWLCIQKNNQRYLVAEYQGTFTEFSLKQVKDYLAKWISDHHIDLICIHNLFEIELVELLLTLKPVVKFSHSPVLVCPGRDKYWRFSQKPCTIPYGMHCFWHIYSEGCSNRHPKRIWKAWNYVRKELEFAKDRYQKIVVMSTYNSGRLLECNVPADKIVVNPYFTRYVDTIPEAIPRETVRILFIGRIISGKGVPEMLHAVEPVLKKHTHVHLDIIGDGLQMNEVKKMVTDKGIEGNVMFHGWLPRQKIDKLLAECYLVIFPSIYPESFGIVGIESMMNGKPVVAFNVGGVSTWLKNGENGFLLKSGDHVQMSQAIEKLLTDKELYKRMSRHAREIAVEQFTPDVHFKKLISVFDNAVTSQ
jgi:Glycosyltransferase